MKNLFRDILRPLFSLFIGIPETAMNTLFFPPRREPTVELPRSRVHSQFALIRSLQDQVSFQTGVIQELRRDNRNLQNLLNDYKKEIEELKKRIRSMEIERGLQARRR